MGMEIPVERTEDFMAAYNFMLTFPELIEVAKRMRLQLVPDSSQEARPEDAS